VEEVKFKKKREYETLLKTMIIDTNYHITVVPSEIQSSPFEITELTALRQSKDIQLTVKHVVLIKRYNYKKYNLILIV